MEKQTQAETERKGELEDIALTACGTVFFQRNNGQHRD